MPAEDLTDAAIRQCQDEQLIAAPADELTGVLTRAAFKQALTLYDETTSCQYLIVVDLDYFQRVNDGFGHDTGDRVLQLAAKRIRRLVGNAGVVGRSSGDEFAVFFPDPDADISAYAESIQDKLARPYTAEGNAVAITVSAGVATTAEARANYDDLIQAAHIALHEAETKRNKGVVFDPAMLDRAKFTTALEQDLRATLAYERTQIRQAAALEQFSLRFQPILRNDRRDITAFEALLRWEHPERGHVSPADFVPLAEELGLINQIGAWVLHTACNHAAGWQPNAAGNAPSVCVNVSPYQLREGNAFLATVRDALAASGLPANRLTIEVTENAFVHDSSGILTGLREMGVSLAIDDFGTGYSSLSHILRFPFTTIKIDKYFIHALRPEAEEDGINSGSAAWLVRAIGALGAGLGIATVAEGVETSTELSIVEAAGITHTQGFLYGRPMTADNVTERLAALSEDITTAATH